MSREDHYTQKPAQRSWVMLKQERERGRERFRFYLILFFVAVLIYYCRKLNKKTMCT